MGWCAGGNGSEPMCWCVLCVGGRVSVERKARDHGRRCLLFCKSSCTKRKAAKSEGQDQECQGRHACEHQKEKGTTCRMRFARWKGSCERCALFALLVRGALLPLIVRDALFAWIIRDMGCFDDIQRTGRDHRFSRRDGWKHSERVLCGEKCNTGQILGWQNGRLSAPERNRKHHSPLLCEDFLQGLFEGLASIKAFVRAFCECFACDGFESRSDAHPPSAHRWGWFEQMGRNQLQKITP